MDALAGVRISVSDMGWNTLPNKLDSVLRRLFQRLPGYRRAIDFADKGRVEPGHWVMFVLCEPLLSDTQHHLQEVSPVQFAEEILRARRAGMPVPEWTFADFGNYVAQLDPIGENVAIGCINGREFCFRYRRDSLLIEGPAISPGAARPTIG